MWKKSKRHGRAPVINPPPADRGHKISLFFAARRSPRGRDPGALFNVLPVGQPSNDQDDEIGMVLPLAYFASGGNYSMIRMMKWFPFTRFGGIGLKCIYPWGRGGRLMR